MLTQCRVHSTIPAADIDRARSWYADRLGFEPVRELPGGLMYDAADGTRFIIFPSPNAGKSPNTIMGFATPDLDAEVRELKQRGVVFEEYDYPTLKTVDCGSHEERMVPRFGGEHHRRRGPARVATLARAVRTAEAAPGTRPPSGPSAHPFRPG